MKFIKKSKTGDKSDTQAYKDQQDDKKQNNDVSNASSESEQLHVVKIIGHKKNAKEGFMFFLKFSDDSTEWSTFYCAIIDCPSLLREYMRKNQKVAPKENKPNSVSTSVRTPKETPNPRPETITKPVRRSSRNRNDNASVLI